MCSFLRIYGTEYWWQVNLLEIIFFFFFFFAEFVLPTMDFSSVVSSSYDTADPFAEGFSTGRDNLNKLFTQVSRRFPTKDRPLDSTHPAEYSMSTWRHAKSCTIGAIFYWKRCDMLQWGFKEPSTSSEPMTVVPSNLRFAASKRGNPSHTRYWWIDCSNAFFSLPNSPAFERQWQGEQALFNHWSGEKISSSPLWWGQHVISWVFYEV